MSSKEEKPTKKPFDKKKWRTKKYSNKQKYRRFSTGGGTSTPRSTGEDVKDTPKKKESTIEGKIQDWDERRKKAVIRDYYKELNKSGIERPLGVPNNDDNNIISSKPKKLNPHKEAKERYDQIQEQKRARRLEASKKEEISQKQIEYLQRKKRRNKILGKKTKKGQPVMKDRLQLLLEKIQSDCVNNDN